jgi:hypothetical protein
VNNYRLSVKHYRLSAIAGFCLLALALLGFPAIVHPIAATNPRTHTMKTLAKIGMFTLYGALIIASVTVFTSLMLLYFDIMYK